MSWCISVKTVGSGDTSTSSIRATAATATATASASAVTSASADVDVAGSACSESAKAEGSVSTPLDLYDSVGAVGGCSINNGTGGNGEEPPTKRHDPGTGNGNNPSTFTITVEPDSPISCLHSSIEAVTGLAASQQRLIYRGRIIQSSPVPTSSQAQQAHAHPGRSEDGGIGERNRTFPQSQSTPPSSTSTSTSNDTRDEQQQRKCRQSQPSGRIRDVSGLGDGQTIHLVPRPRPASSSPSGVGSGSPPGSLNSTSTSDSSDGNGGDSSSTAATASLLATLLGLGASSTSAVSPVVVRDRDRDGEDPSAASPNTNTTDGATEDASTLLGLSSLLRRTTDLQGRRDQGSIRSAAGRRRLVDRRRRQGGGGGPPPRGPGPGRPPVREPGSLEPVRQGLMTLHTMLHQHQHQHERHQQGDGAGTEAADNAVMTNMTTATTTTTPSPTDARRRFYLGQWVDVRDTVNQWLEATIIDVALPREVLLQSEESSESVTSTGGDDGSIARTNHVVGTTGSTGSRRRLVGEEPIIAADDLLGRRALLLESPSSHAAPAAVSSAGAAVEDDDRGVQDSSMPEGERARARERPGNEHVQLLLVHYNGWPHRWDEWIRSDSERIRPFRTRTVHSRPLYACPTVQSIFPDSPSTTIATREEYRDYRERERGEGTADRAAVLPEISRAIAGVGSLLSELVEEDDFGVDHNDYDDEGNTGSQHASSSSLQEVEEKLEDGGCDDGGDSNGYGFLATQSTDPGSSANSHLPWLPSNSRATGRTNTSESGRRREERKSGGYSREALNALAPLLDRLGRTLVDAAPHVVALAASLPCEEGHARGEEASAATATAMASSSYSSGFSPSVSVATRRETPLLRASESSSTTTSDEDRDALNLNDDEYADFVNGMVNARSAHSGRPPSAGTGTNSDTTGGSVAGGGGLRRNRQSSTDTGSGANDGGRTGSLLATYLAAASLAGLGLASAGEGNSNSGTDTNSDNDNEGGGLGGSDEGGTANEDTSGISALARLLGGGGGGGNGGNIDIHIHAVVTPGFEPGGLAFAALPPVATAQAVAPPTGSGSSTGNPSSATAGSPATAPTYMNTVSEEDEDLGLFDELYSEVQLPSASSSFGSLTRWSNGGEDDDDIGSTLAIATTASEEGSNQEDQDITSLMSPDEEGFAPAVGLEPVPRGEERSMNDESSVDSFHSVRSGNDRNTSVDQCTSARGATQSQCGAPDGSAVAENSFSEPSAKHIVKRRGSSDDANICPIGQEEEPNKDNVAHEQVAGSSSWRSDIDERRGSSRREYAAQTPSSQIGSRSMTASESPSPTRSGGRRASRLMRVLRRSVGRR